VYTFHDLVEPVIASVTEYGDLPEVGLLNILQAVVLSNSEVAITVQGGLQHLIAMIVPTVYIQNIRGPEMNEGEYACQSRQPQVSKFVVLDSYDATLSFFFQQCTVYTLQRSLSRLRSLWWRLFKQVLCVQLLWIQSRVQHSFSRTQKVQERQAPRYELRLAVLQGRMFKAGTRVHIYNVVLRPGLPLVTGV